MELIHGVVGCNRATAHFSAATHCLSLSLSCFTDTLFSRSAPRVGTLVAVAQQNTPDPVIKSCVIAERVRYRALAVCPASTELAVTCRKQKARQLDRVILLGFLFAFVKVTGLMNSSTWLTRRPSLIRRRLNNQDVSAYLLHQELYSTSSWSWNKQRLFIAVRKHFFYIIPASTSGLGYPFTMPLTYQPFLAYCWPACTVWLEKFTVWGLLIVMFVY